MSEDLYPRHPSPFTSPPSLSFAFPSYLLPSPALPRRDFLSLIVQVGNPYPLSSLAISLSFLFSSCPLCFMSFLTFLFFSLFSRILTSLSLSFLFPSVPLSLLSSLFLSSPPLPSPHLQSFPLPFPILPFPLSPLLSFLSLPSPHFQSLTLPFTTLPFPFNLSLPFLFPLFSDHSPSLPFPSLPREYREPYRLRS